MSKANTLSGSYTTRRDGGVGYTYDVTWNSAGSKVNWTARIKREGRDAQIIDRSTSIAGGVHLEHALRNLVEHAIEHLSQSER